MGFVSWSVAMPRLTPAEWWGVGAVALAVIAGQYLAYLFPVHIRYTLKIEMVGDHIQCSLNGKKYLDARDATFKDAGKLGLWTKADAQTHFDNFMVTAK